MRALLLLLCLAACGDDSKPAPSDGGTPPPSGWRSVVGQGGYFAQTFDDATWVGRFLAKQDLYAVACVGNLIGWTAGQGGAVLHTTDGGKSWITQDSTTREDLFAIRFDTAQIGAAAGKAGTLLVTSDGGTTWRAAPHVTGETLRGVTVAAGVTVAVGDRATIVRSHNGRAFVAATIPGAADLRGVATDPGAREIVAVDSAGAIWSSRDRGVSFARVATAREPLYAVSLDHHGGRGLAVGARGTILRRVDGAWIAAHSPTGVDLYAALVPHEGKRTYAAGAEGTLLVSDDDGATFAPQPVSSKSALFGLEDL
jgi:photosystem II stability/assembly factor-like uncharacterized protein